MYIKHRYYMYIHLHAQINSLKIVEVSRQIFLCNLGKTAIYGVLK